MLQVMVSSIFPAKIALISSIFPAISVSVCACTDTTDNVRHNASRETINFIFIIYPRIRARPLGRSYLIK
ncbi:hypothetical protein MSBRW_3085 [Methanosarcina barkeri str. Wiesmoor]|uniref:Uncharacterized protein n=1 Tax=Methanosarcina barkeri str. Wiesmoor TaxID=1434109 RepID=A0A0E3QPC3_METBA|nr:hypothetical protein MSBRW_3085 [Methanosarcina barkeri str. Wiesmoor]